MGEIANGDNECNNTWSDRNESRLAFLFIWTSLLGAILLLNSCNPPFSQTENDKAEDGKEYIQATDIRGKTVRLPKPAERIVVLYQAALDGLYMLGAEERIVGIQNRIYTNPETFRFFGRLDTRIANREIAAPGNWENSTNMESVVALKPDLVILPSGLTDAIAMLEDLNINVFAVSPVNNEQLFEEMEALGVLTDTEARAEELLSYTATKLKEIKDQTSSVTDKKKVYYAWSGGRIYSTSGRNSRMHECFELAGVENACPFEIDTPNINPESLISWDPDIFLLWNTDPAELYARKELSVLRAVQNKQVHVFEPPFFYDPHTLKIMYMAMELNNVAYAEKGSFDLESNRREIMQSLYGDKSKRLFE